MTTTETPIMNSPSQVPLLTPIPPGSEQARVQAIFAKVEEIIGFVPDPIRLYSLSPALLETFVANVGYFRQHPTLRGELMAMIRYLTSVSADCRFCIDLNEAILVNGGIERSAIQATREDIDQAPFEPNENALLKFAVGAVDDPDAIGTDDLNSLREQGWSDGEIFDSVVQASNNRALNILLKTFNVHHQGSFD